MENKMTKDKKELNEIIKELDEARYRQKLILSALRNLLYYNNPKGVNDCLIAIIDRTKWKLKI